jgi:protein TonB
MMNGMSFNGGGGSTSGGRATRGLDLSLPQSNSDAAGPPLSATGDVGADWLAEMKQWLEDHVYYPAGAAELGQSGRVLVRYEVTRDGKVFNLSMVTGSGYPILNQAVLGILRNAIVPRFPPGTKSNTTTVMFTMEYTLNQ